MRWSILKTAFTCVLIVVLLLAMPMIYHAYRQVTDALAGIVYAGSDWNERRMLSGLAGAISRDPTREVYYVRQGRGWGLTLDPDDEEKWETIYDRREGILKEIRPGSGDLHLYLQRWLKVGDSAIRRAASGSGRFEELAKYGCINSMP